MDLGNRLPFLNEDELLTFDGWLKYQGFDYPSLTGAERAGVHEMFEDAVRRRASTPRIGRMKLGHRAGESRYGVAVREGSDLWLALWVRQSPKGEFFVMLPRPDGQWNPHNSLHGDGTFHGKSHDHKMFAQQKQRPDSIRGSEHLGSFGGYSPKAIGALCDPADFTGVFEAPSSVLGPRNGVICVDLLERPDSPSLEQPFEEVARHLFGDVAPYVLVRVFPS
jgi:hypothetical protein